MSEKTNTGKIEINSKSFNDDEKKTMISINNVSMTFNMASEQLNNLKEYFLAIVKHKLFFEELNALQNVNFEIKQGDVFGIIGTNGSGKSTLLKIIAGVLEPSEGTVEINGGIAPLIELGAGFDMELSARENIYLNGALLGYSKSFIEQHFDEIVKFSEIEKFLDMPMKNYSSGMIARIAFAIATVIVPEILIVDEVLSVGDFMFQKKCEDKILELIKNHNTTVLIVSHSNDQIRRLCNKAIWIEKGKTRLIGNAKDVCDIYGLVGGRQGAIESENLIINAINDESVADAQSASFHVQGSSSPELSLSLAKHAPKEEIKSVCLCSMQTHINSSFANALAGKLNAPVISIKHEGVDYPIIDWLNEHKPEEIYIFNLTNSTGPKELANYRFDYSPKIIEFNHHDNLNNISKYMFEETFEILDKPACAFIGTFQDSIETSVSFGPLSYYEKIPFLCIDPASITPTSFAETCKDYGIKKVINISPTIDKKFLDYLSKNSIKVENLASTDKSKTFLALAEKTCELFKGEIFGEALIIPQNGDSCIDAASAGYYASKARCPILVIDNRSLDSIADAITFLKKHKIKRVTFLDSIEALSLPIVEVLSKTAKKNQS